MIPNILSIAGSDPSGGAGIQADIKAISANGGYAMAVITALTAQNTQAVTAVHMITPDFVAAQIAAIRADIRVDAVKIGMLGDAGIIAAVVKGLSGLRVPIVLDPVMVAKSGTKLCPSSIFDLSVDSICLNLLQELNLYLKNRLVANKFRALPKKENTYC